jgi:hypothetical protein
MVKSIKSYLGIIHRLGLLAKSSLASKLTSSCRVFRRIFKQTHPPPKTLKKKKKKRKLSACRGEGSVVGLQLRVRFVPAALLAMLRTALALQCVSKARDWTGHVDR